MSVLPPPLAGLHRFYRSMPTPCPYLEGRIERKLFTRLIGADPDTLNSTLTRAGFRRSHDVLYRPVCVGCAACVPVRIPVQRLKLDRTQRRIARRNEDLRVSEAPSRATPELFRLFLAYQLERHPGGEMGQMQYAEFRAMLEEGAASAQLLLLRDATGTLVGAMLFDRLGDGSSAVYSFYDASAPQRSLGTYLVLALARWTLTASLPYLYLGYWIEGSPKMTYKARFRPIEALGPEGWAMLTDPAPASAWD